MREEKSLFTNMDGSLCIVVPFNAILCNTDCPLLPLILSSENEDSLFDFLYVLVM